MTRRAPGVVRLRVRWSGITALVPALVLTACTRRTGEDEHVRTRGSVEVTARLVEVPAGAIFQRGLYDYATVLKYEVLQVHRGQVAGPVIYVAHYNPFKPRSQAADRFVKDIGGDAAGFAGGDVHRMALEPDADRLFMGGMVNKYFEQPTGTIYWALWTNEASR